MDLGVLVVIASGLAAGAAHVVSGVDHLAALLPLSVGGRLRAFGLGARWGLGHSLGVLLVGALAVGLRSRLDLESLGQLGESAVGVMLVGIGALGLRRALKVEVHAHDHDHDGRAHSHWHLHAAGDDDHAAQDRRHAHTAFAAGTVHGVAGTAHVLGVLPAVALPGTLMAGAYLVSFGAATVATMGVFAGVVGELSGRVSADRPRLLKRLLLGASASTVLVGLLWLAAPFLGLELPA
jgi:ABC-type nickel/cobalt efflux system permease component RcnA